MISATALWNVTIHSCYIRDVPKSKLMSEKTCLNSSDRSRDVVLRSYETEVNVKDEFEKTKKKKSCQNKGDSS